MSAAWMMYAVLVSALVVPSALAAEGICGAFRLPQRFAWLGAVAALVILVGVAAFRPALADGIALPQAVVVEGGVGALAGPDRPGSAGPLAAAKSLVEWPLRLVAALGLGGGADLLLYGWLLLSAALLSLTLLTLVGYRRAVRRWPRTRVSGVGVSVSPRAGPAVIGVLRPRIVIPEWVANGPTAVRRVVVLHEAEHVRARDPLLLAIGWLWVCATPFNPFAWWLMHRLRLAVEIDCDRRVVRSGVAAREYGSLLIDVAGRTPGLTLGAAAIAASPGTLERRLTAMTTTPSAGTLVRSTALAILGAVALLTACEARLPTASEIEAMDAAAVERTARDLRLSQFVDGPVRWEIDGVAVTEEQAKALPAASLARVEVEKSTVAEETIIRLYTSQTVDPEGLERSSLEAKPGILEAPEGLVPVTVRDTAVVSDRGIRVRPIYDEFRGVLLVDGVRTEPSGLRRLQYDQIEGIEVIKGAAAVREYGPDAAGGLIKVTTKAAGRR